MERLGCTGWLVLRRGAPRVGDRAQAPEEAGADFTADFRFAQKASRRVLHRILGTEAGAPSAGRAALVRGPHPCRGGGRAGAVPRERHYHELAHT